MNVPTDKTTFTLAEAAALLSCHRETLRRAIRSGNLRAARLGRGFRISRFDLEAFWSACGGGELFAWGEAEPADAPNPSPRTGKKKRQIEQLSLPGAENTNTSS